MCARSLSLFPSAYTDPDLTYGTRNVNFKFRTVKTPELHYDPRLLMHKGVREHIHNSHVNFFYGMLHFIPIHRGTAQHSVLTKHI